MEVIEVYFETRVTKFTLALLVARRARGKTTHANARLLKEISCVEKSSALFYFCFVRGLWYARNSLPNFGCAEARRVQVVWGMHIMNTVSDTDRRWNLHDASSPVDTFPDSKPRGHTSLTHGKSAQKSDRGGFLHSTLRGRLENRVG